MKKYFKLTFMAILLFLAIKTAIELLPYVIGFVLLIFIIDNVRKNKINEVKK